MKVRGKVQGVGFRASTVQEARQFPGLKGFVRNLADGSVEAVFCGEPVAVLEMAAWCKDGPRSAQVVEIEVREEKVDSTLGEFKVLR